MEAVENETTARAVPAERAAVPARTFDVPPGRTERIGLEIEAGLVDPLTGASLPYTGARSVTAFLRAAADLPGWWSPGDRGGGNVTGLLRADGAEVTVESGGAVEYVSAPATGLAGLLDRAAADLTDLAAVADAGGAALLGGAILPFETEADVPWAPKPRVPLMLEYFRRRLGPDSEGWAAMSRILSVQVTLDYLDHEDLARKFRTANAVSAPLAALFVNSPLYQGRPAGYRSRRMAMWANVDRRRVGLFPHSIRPDFRVEHLVSWALGLEPILRGTPDGGVAAPPPGRSFRSLLTDGYGDGTYPSDTDWRALLATAWPYVRLRRTLELRIPDGPPPAAWRAVPAVWVGLLYDRSACDDAWELMRGYTLAEHLAAVDDVAARGLAAGIGRDPVLPLARQLLAIARDGLARRVAAGAEPERVLDHLDAVEEVAATGVSFADRQLARWSGAMRRDPARYVAEYRHR